MMSNRSTPFAGLLAAAGMTQAEYARLTGRTRGTVNRWCSSGRRDAVAPPAEAVGFVLALALLSKVDRAAVLARITGDTP